MEGPSNIKCEDFEIKSEDNFSDIPLQKLKDEPFDWTNTNLLTNSLNVKKEIEDIWDDAEKKEIESCSNIKIECVEIKKEVHYSDTPSPNLKEEPVDSTNECQSEYVKTTNTSTLKRKGKPYDSREKQGGLKQGVSETIFKCNSCHYQTDRKKNMRHHRFKHMPEEQMFKCDSCEYKSAYKRDFALHQRQHKGVPEEQMFKCDSCDYKTIYKSRFNHHQLTHKDIPEEEMFQCDLCDYKTIYKSYFTQHQLRKHTEIPEEKKFKCDLCGYKTVHKRSFVLHQRRHIYIGENQYTCNLCDYKTIYKPYLDYHLGTH